MLHLDCQFVTLMVLCHVDLWGTHGENNITCDIVRHTPHVTAHGACAATTVQAVQGRSKTPCIWRGMAAHTPASRHTGRSLRGLPKPTKAWGERVFPRNALAIGLGTSMPVQRAEIAWLGMTPHVGSITRKESNSKRT